MRRPPLHPACKIFPALGQDELQELADDISVNGLRNPVVLYQGKILDGRNRWEACKIAKVKPQFTEFDGDDPIGWVVSQNLVRRHLTASQRAVVAFGLLPLLEREAKERQKLSRGRGKKVRKNLRTFSANGRASQIAARMTKTNSAYVQAVKAISKTAPELIDEIRAGRVTVLEAKRLAQRNAPSNGQNGKKRKIPKGNRKRITCGDCMKLIPTLDDESVNLVLCSPPYAEQRKRQYNGVSEADYPTWTVEWMGLLWDKLADDGSVLIIIRPHINKGVLSDYVLRTRLALRDDGWTECDELIWSKPDAPPLGNNRRPRRTWESIFRFAKSSGPYCNPTACGKQSNRLGFDGSLRFGLGGDSPVHAGQNLNMRTGTARCSDVFVAPVASNPKGIDHPAMFPESLAEQLILTFSRVGDLVVDCFCGAGSTLAAAKKHGRDYRGFDISRKYARLAQERLARLG
jgi:DNA modification methylase